MTFPVSELSEIVEWTTERSHLENLSFEKLVMQFHSDVFQGKSYKTVVEHYGANNKWLYTSELSGLRIATMAGVLVEMMLLSLD